MPAPPDAPAAPHSKPSLVVRLDDDALKALDAWAREEGLTAGALALRLLLEALEKRARKPAS